MRPSGGARLVPNDSAVRPCPRLAGQPLVQPPVQSAGQPGVQPAELAALREAIDTLRDQLEQAHNFAERAGNRADFAVKRAKTAEQVRERAEDRADRVEVGRDEECSRADALRDPGRVADPARHGGEGGGTGHAPTPGKPRATPRHCGRPTVTVGNGHPSAR